MTNANNSFHETESKYGITLREWFAAQALIGILSNTNDQINVSADARLAVEVADELIGALNEGAGQ